MSANYDLIATVDIDITNPIVDDASFDNILIVGPLPAVAPATAPALCARYSGLDAVEEAGWVSSGSGADPVGIAARVAFSQPRKPKNIWIAPIQKTTVDSSTVNELLLVTVKRALDKAGWYVVCPAGVEATVDSEGSTVTVAQQFAAVAAYIETQEKMFCYTDLVALASAGASALVTGEFYRTIGVYGRETSAQPDVEIPVENLYMNVAFAVEWLSYQSGSETSAFKTLAVVTPSDLATTEIDHLVDLNLCYVITVGGRIITMNGKTLAGEWADIIRFRDWLKNDMQVRVVNLMLTNAKIPYTDSGIALVQNQMLAALKAGVNAGGIAEEEFDEDGNSIPSYVTSVPLASSITASQKASRNLVDCTFKARLAGAIHFAELKGSLTYEL